MGLASHTRNFQTCQTKRRANFKL